MAELIDNFLVETINALPQAVFYTIVCAFLLKKIFSTYLDEKQKNLATKQDIEEITKKQEETIKNIEYKYKYTYERYSNLFSPLYAIICQSEYLRHLLGEDTTDNSFDKYPFYELSEKKNKYCLSNINKPISSIEINDEVTEANKYNMVKLIIENEKFASQELLKMSREYMVVYKFCSENDDGSKVAEFTNKVDAEENRLIKEIVSSIVKEYNSLRKNLNMDYNNEELSTGIPKMSYVYIKEKK